MLKGIRLLSLCLLTSCALPLLGWAQEELIVVSFERKVRDGGMMEYHYLMMDKDRLFPLFLPFNGSGGVDVETLDTVLLNRIHYPSEESVPVFPGDCLNDMNGGFAEDLTSSSCPESVQRLLSVVHQKWQRVQVIKKQRGLGRTRKGYSHFSRYDETISVYLTPVIGQFEKGWKYEFFGVLEYACYSYTPISEISYNSAFMGSSNWNRIIQLDFSCVDYSRFTPRNVSSEDNLQCGVVRVFEPTY